MKIEDPEEFEDQIYSQQVDLIRKRFGREAADQANYGWGVNEGDRHLTIETKVYVDPQYVLISEGSYADGSITHEWRERA